MFFLIEMQRIPATKSFGREALFTSKPLRGDNRSFRDTPSPPSPIYLMKILCKITEFYIEIWKELIQWIPHDYRN